MPKRSGHGPRYGEFEDDLFADMQSYDFKKKVFQTKDALRTNDGHEWTEYVGQSYEGENWELVKGLWDHEHCFVCFSRIVDNMTYWSNFFDEDLCDDCFDHYRPEIEARLRDERLAK